MEKKIIFGAIAKPTIDVPLYSCIKMYEVNQKDCNGDNIVLIAEEVYQHKNKKFEGKKSFNIEKDFKGIKGEIKEFHDMREISNFLETIIDKGYHVQRLTRHGENDFSDDMFQKVMSYSMKKQTFVLPI